MKISRKVLFSTLAALATSAAVVLSEGLPDSLTGWLVVIGKILGGTAVVGGVGYQVTETRPSPSAIRAARLKL